VSNEVGLGLVPDNELGRTFRDVLGRVNALAASRATAAYLVVAGRVLAIEEFPLDLERREPG
jgi:adenosylcobinamide kinase/adenosylcobinamide-phosphate guanylyltransferase